MIYLPSPCSEFPHDNPALSQGTAWVCLEPCAAPRALLRPLPRSSTLPPGHGSEVAARRAPDVARAPEAPRLLDEEREPRAPSTTPLTPEAAQAAQLTEIGELTEAAQLTETAELTETAGGTETGQPTEPGQVTDPAEATKAQIAQVAQTAESAEGADTSCAPPAAQRDEAIAGTASNAQQPSSAAAGAARAADPQHQAEAPLLAGEQPPLESQPFEQADPPPEAASAAHTPDAEPAPPVRQAREDDPCVAPMAARSEPGAERLAPMEPLLDGAGPDSPTPVSLRESRQQVESLTRSYLRVLPVEPDDERAVRLAVSCLRRFKEAILEAAPPSLPRAAAEPDLLPAQTADAAQGDERRDDRREEQGRERRGASDAADLWSELVRAVRRDTRRGSGDASAAPAAPQATPAQSSPAQSSPAQNTPAQSSPAQNTPAPHAPARNTPTRDALSQSAARTSALDPFETFVQLLCRTALDVGATRAAGALRELLGGGPLRRERLGPAAAERLVAGGILSAEGGALVRTARFERLRAVWAAALRGEAADLGVCGEQTLDAWASSLLTLLSAEQLGQVDVRRTLRAHGVAAFGLVRAA